MDEILIEEKKYISSKRAAKVTGYAKDYIGQLCREGRVPARLVGRNWYVLETAIQDHRFGESNLESENTVHDAPLAHASAPTWESPRYEAISADTFSSISRPTDADEGDKKEENETPQHLQNSWKEWFDRVADTATSVIPDVIPEKSVEKEEEKEVNIPIRAIHQSRYQSPPEELLPRHYATNEGKPIGELEEVQTRRWVSGKAIMAIQVVGALFAVLSVILAVIGSGYFDKYILSSNRASVISGGVLYNR